MLLLWPSENGQEAPNCWQSRSPQATFIKVNLTHHLITMLALDPITLFFYTRIVSNNDQDHPPSEKRRGTCDSISTWIDDTLNYPPLLSQVNSKTSFNHLPSLTVGSTWSSSNLALINGIQITQNTQLPTGTEKAYIKVKEKGIYSDYDETKQFLVP